ncbi:hypothetical protein PC111_g4567 [Phytophthora cactorum]|nr:hypothetical protein PC111_g4567 [Phytophthora cactorum]
MLKGQRDLFARWWIRARRTILFATRVCRRHSVTFSHEFDGFQGSDDFLAIDLSDSFDCVFGIPWLARHQPNIDWLTRTVSPRDIDVNAVLAFLSGTPNNWPHVAVMDPDSMGPLRETRAGPDLEPQGTSDVVEHAFPRPNEQRLSEDEVVERGLPQAVGQGSLRVVERKLPGEDEYVVEHGLPHVVERELPDEVDAVESSSRPMSTDSTHRCHQPADLIERGLSSSTVESAPRPVRRRGRCGVRRPRAPSECSASPETEVISVLMSEGDDNVARVRDVEVARPPSDAAPITHLPGLSWKHFLRDLKRRELEQVCMVVPETTASLTAVAADADATASDPRSHPKQAEPKTAREAMFAAQSLPALEASGNLLHLSSVSSSTFSRKKVPADLPPDSGVRHEIDLTPGAKYCVDAIDTFFESRRRAGHVRESVSLHSSPTFCAKKASGGWHIVHAFNKLNDVTTPAQTPIPRKEMVMDTMSGSIKYSTIDLMDGFYQILMREDDVPLTAVSTPSGMLLEWLVMPQGLTSVPATFNPMVSNLLRPFRDFAPSYFDDIFIHSRADGSMTDVEVHLQHLRQVFQVMRDNKLYANLKKRIFCAPEIPALGSYVSKEGVRADPEKVAAICAWPTPQDQK